MATGNVAQVTDKETKETKKKTTRTKAKAKAAKPEPEKVEAVAPEPEPAAEPEPETNGEKQVEELVTTEATDSTTKATIPVEEAPPTTERAINEKIQKDRQEQTQKMFGGQVEEAQLEGTPRFVEASIFPDAYCPLCGLKLSGNSKTGFKQAFYVHPFAPSITLGKPCELKGKKLRAPTARMEIVED